jgi:threonine dehydrogenase-like Zn-dependent dehydrogenase
MTAPGRVHETIFGRDGPRERSAAAAGGRARPRRAARRLTGPRQRLGRGSEDPIMKAVVFHGVGDIRLDDVSEPRIEEPTDAIVRLTMAAICGTDLHMVRGTMAGMKKGTVLGHEGVGVVEELGKDVRNLKVGDRVVIPSTIACGNCSYCREGLYAQCDCANPNGKHAGTAFFGGPKQSGPFQGLQAERARIPFANIGLVRLPDDVSDEEAILLSDIAPTAWFGADMANIHEGSTVAVFGCGPVGMFAIIAARMMGAGRIFAIDTIPDRLEAAREQGAEVIDFKAEDPVETIMRLTDGIGVDRVIDAVGVDAEPPSSREAEKEDVKKVAPKQNPDGDNWRPGRAPAKALEWAVEVAAKAGIVSIIGVYPPTMDKFPIGQAMNKNLKLVMGNCNHRRYIPELIELVQTGALRPTEVLSRTEPIMDVIEAYRAFDERRPGWLKVALATEATEGHSH